MIFWLVNGCTRHIAFPCFLTIESSWCIYGCLLLLLWIDPAITSDHSSSSTDSSPTGGTRKSSYLSRKSKSKTSVQSGSSVKQRVRSSSGYSSHTEETSFRFDPFLWLRMNLTWNVFVRLFLCCVVRSKVLSKVAASNGTCKYMFVLMFLHDWPAIIFIFCIVFGF